MQKRTKSWISLIKPIALLSVLILMLSVTSYAWIKRNWQPTIQQNELSVSTGGSLAFKLSTSAPTTTFFEIADAVPQYRDMELQPLSSLSGDGSDFFNIARASDGSGKATFNKINTNTQAAASFGYIDITFLMVSNEADIHSENADRYTRFVYLDETTQLEDAVTMGGVSAAAALRISLTTLSTTASGSQPKTILLWNRKEGTPAAEEEHVAVSPRLKEGATGQADDLNNFEVHGKDVPVDDQFTFNPELHEKNPNIKPLDYYCGFDKADGQPNRDSPNPEDRCLFSIAAGDQKIVTLRIWMEGQDPNCTDALAARKINLRLVFNSYLYDNTEKKVVTTNGDS